MQDCPVITPPENVANESIGAESQTEDVTGRGINPDEVNLSLSDESMVIWRRLAGEIAARKRSSFSCPW
ncbi:unnamed protein product [Schistosoma turkestanicum]|nr:unnamed protein product [Schistosoma turkestanicum]